jgi:thioredoxin reductase
MAAMHTGRVRIAGVSAPSQTVSIRFAGRAIACRPGDTLAAALVAAGELSCRETAGGERRGLFCGMGVCRECAVTIDGRPGELACMTAVRDGMVVERQPAAPVLAAVPDEPRRRTRLLAPDVLIVGAGPAGLAAAAAAGEAGLDAVLLDERPKLGGQYFKQPPEEAELDERALDRQFRTGRALIARVRRAGVRFVGGVRVWGAFAPDELAATGDGARYVLRPRRLIVATGAYERAIPIPGWTLPGVMTTGAAQTLLRAHQVAPGRRVLVSGNGPLNAQVAAELAHAGADVVALAELADLARPARAGALAGMLATEPRLVGDGLRLHAALVRRRVPVLGGCAVIRVGGSDRVERAVVARIGRDGLPVAGSEREYAVDAVCVGFGFAPSNELARALGCRHVYDPARRTLVTARDDRGRTSLDGVWVAGDGAAVGGALVARSDGLVAGADVARSLERALPAALAHELHAAERARRRQRRFQRALWRLYRAPQPGDALAAPETAICRCESVSRAAIDAALDGGVEHIGAVKRLTRAGMGACQGRYCGGLMAEAAARRSGRPPDELSGFAPGVPFKPVAISALVGPPPRED